MNPRSGHGMAFTLWNVSAVICLIIAGGPFAWLGNSRDIPDPIGNAIVIIGVVCWWAVVAIAHRMAWTRFGPWTIIPLILFLILTLASVFASQAGW